MFRIAIGANIHFVTHAPGLVVGGYLKLVRPLGQGGMGAVWVAEHLRLGGEVAVKFLSGQYLGDSGTRARFEQEARVSAQVRSPHVVQVMDFGVTETDAPQPYIVMELLSGRDLGKHLEANGPLAPQDVEVVLGQLCQALGHAHGLGVVHRDIKPENVFLVEGPKTFVKLLDFGIALGRNPNEIQRLTQTGLIIGTADYMSPEQVFTAKEVDLRTDLWALGILVYQMLTAQLPFHGDTFGVLCVKLQAGVFKPVTELASVPAGLNAWFRKALATDREQRFQSTDELFGAFQTALTTHTDDVGADPAAAAAPTISASAENTPEVNAGDPAGARLTESKAALSLDAGHTIPKNSPAPFIVGATLVAAAALGWFLLSGSTEQTSDAVASEPKQPVSEASSEESGLSNPQNGASTSAAPHSAPPALTAKREVTETESPPGNASSQTAPPKPAKKPVPVRPAPAKPKRPKKAPSRPPKKTAPPAAAEKTANPPAPKPRDRGF